MVNQLWLGLYKNPHPDWQAESDSNPLNCITRFPIINKAVVKGILAQGWFFIQRIKYFGCIFWRWDCARVRFLAGMNCGLNYLKGKGLKTIRIISFRIVLTNISFSIVLTNHNRYMKLSSFCSSKIMSFLLILTLYLLSFFLISMHCLKPIPFCQSYGNLSYYKFPRFWTEERGNRTTCHKAYIRSYIGKNLLSWPYIFF